MSFLAMRNTYWQVFSYQYNYAGELDPKPHLALCAASS